MLSEEKYFYSRTGAIPSVRQFFEIDAEKALDKLCQAFGVNPSTMIVDDFVNIQQQYHRKYRATVFLTPTLMASWSGETQAFRLYHVNSTDNASFDKAEAVVRSCFAYGTEPSLINLFFSDQTGMRVFQKPLHFQAPDLGKHFNEDLIEADRKIMQQLSDPQQKGVVFLHGQRGTGKTTYLRSLISRLGSRVVLMPAEMTFQMSTPHALPFILNLPGSVILLEDVDAMLVDRSGFGSELSNNLGDFSEGLLSDCVNLKFVVTCNLPLDQIDTGFMRRSLIMASYEFRPLTAARCNKLFEELRPGHHTSKELTLAEVFEQVKGEGIAKSKKGIGFK
jgi:hypothetical protein